MAIEPNSKSTSASPPREGVKPGSTVLPVAGSQTIDLLALADPARHAAVGRWEVQQSGLAILQQTMCGLIQFPVIPAGGFEYETEFTRLSGDGAICLLFPVGNSFVNVEVSGDHGRYSGIGQVNGRGTNSASNPTSRPNSISNNVRYKLAVRVRPSADNQITISEFLDGSELFRWQGDVWAVSGSPFWAFIARLHWGWPPIRPWRFFTRRISACSTAGEERARACPCGRCRSGPAKRRTGRRCGAH